MNDPATEERFERGLAQLPDFEPPSAAWSGIEARLGARARPRRTGLALVAGVVVLALAALGARLAVRPVSPATDAVPTAPALRAAVDAAALERRSSDLEELLAALPPASVGRASTGFTTTLLEDRIAMVDERLSLPDSAELSAATTAALKRQRVVLLDSLVRVKYASAVAASL